jgi:phosphatidylserine decarboxylase
VASDAIAVSAAVAVAAALAWKWQLGVLRVSLAVAAIGVAWSFAPVPAPAVAALTLATAVAILAYRFYRDPEREAPTDAGAVVSPADGEVVYVRVSDDGALPVAAKRGRSYRLDELTGTPLRSARAVVVGIGMSFLDVHVNRAPVGGRVSVRRHFPGRFASLRRPESAFENERATTVIQRGDLQVAVVQIASRLVRQIVGFVHEGDDVAAGQRIGAIRLGSQVDLVLPADAVEVLVRPGDRVAAGTTVVARLVR